MLRSTVVLLVISGTFCTKLDFCDLSNSVNISGGTVFPNGEILAGGIRYDKNEYYYEAGNIWGCSCKEKMCLKKCCPLGQGYHPKKKVCVNTTEVFDPPVWNKYRELNGLRASNLFRFVPGKIDCIKPHYRVAVLLLSQHIHLIKDGNLYVEMPNLIPPWSVRGPDTYCIDTFVLENPDGTKTTRMDALACFETSQEEHYYLLTSTCMLTSCLFILATCAVYAWLPELRNLHGKVLMAYLLCLFFGFCLFSAMQILLYVDNITTNACIILSK
ncbi:unnamed protein product [Diatraea saccharalis]|uniref:Uncharacterized protein n=1 Tax=Diatraea saccharalis TaxID=40085 RepID=A0A9N9R0F2_9NEOP|nr:unnamed protein product [Diatraea saccharalis]